MNSETHTPADQPPPQANVSRSARSKRWVWFGIRLCVTGACLVWMFSRIALQDFLNAAQRLQVSSVLCALLLTYAGLAVAALRWKILLAAYGVPQTPPLRELGLLNWMGFFLNTFFPGNVAGDVLRAHRTQQLFSTPIASYMVVMIERVFGLAGLLLLGASVLMTTHIQGMERLPLFALGGVIVAVSAALSPILVKRWSHYLPERFAKLAKDLPILQTPAALIVALLLSVTTHSLVALTGHILIVSVQPSVTLSQSFVLMPLTTVATYFPAAVAGMGVREAAFVLLFGTVGVASHEATAASLAFLLVQLLAALSGGLVYLLSGSKTTT